MRRRGLRRAIALTLSTGMLFALPAILPQQIVPAVVAQAAAGAQDTNWSFSDGLEGWTYGGKWAYKGEPEISASTAFGGTVRFGVDFSQDAGESWSEVKLAYGTAEKQPLDVTGANVVTYDFYYNPAAMTAGQFKTKIYAKDTKDQEVINTDIAIDMEKARDAGNGWKVVPVTMSIPKQEGALTYFVVSVVGSNTDYKGDIFIGKLHVGFEAVADGYVDVQATAKLQSAVDLSKLQIPSVASLVDKDALPATARTYAYLKGIAASDVVLYGHQNEMNRKVSTLPGPSDTYDMVKDFPAIIGMDGLALTGDELDLTDAERARGETYATKLAHLVLPAAKQGAILTMSCHMPNFAEVAKRPKVNGAYDYRGYSPTNTSGNVVKRILPSGDLNVVYTGYLDRVAEFLGLLQKQDVPVIFRPFHENNGSWFWWGAAHCTASEYKNLFRYTVEYLRDQKGLHNVLYAYSPGGPVVDSADYLSRYPGDAFVDITGFDLYHRDPQKTDDWMENFDQSIATVEHFADEHDKLAAVTETGILVGTSGGALARTGNARLDWFNEAMRTIAPHKMAYFMTWSNFNEKNFDQPYLVTPKRGHEMVNAFIDFYNAPQSIFASQTPDLSKLVVTVQPAARVYGYLTSPSSMERVLQPETLRAHVAGAFAQASFVLMRKDGSVIAKLPAKVDGDGVVVGNLGADVLASAGTTVGQIELQLDGESADRITVLFNMPEPSEDPALVDDFEHYYGDGGLLKAAYSTNCGAGCTVEPLLTATHHGGDTGLDFRYTITKSGYAGIVKSLGGIDWSSYDAVQFWVQPDGRGQKLICQLNSNGEDFEVDLTDVAQKTTPQLVTLPFAAFKGKNGGTFDPSAVQHFAIYCNTVGNETVRSHFYFDDIRAVTRPS